MPLQGLIAKLDLSSFQPFHLLTPLTILPAPASLTHSWRFGSLLGLFLTRQLVSGTLLACFYSPHVLHSFSSVVFLISESSHGWIIRVLHANGASFLFFLLFLHISRGLYFKAFSPVTTWLSGVVLLFVFIGVSFLGYVLPWGQISFWGATVITSLLSTIPYIGSSLISLLWGGFSVRGPTLSRFFVLHFLIPWASVILVLTHLFFLHAKGSSNPLALPRHVDKLPFSPYFTFKDILALSSLFILFLLVCIWAPWTLGDPDNFTLAAPISTPAHIKPEWYFLFAYTILRCIPNKLGGVIGLVFSIAILLIIPFLSNPAPVQIIKSGLSKAIFWRWVRVWVVLSFLGGSPVEYPFLILSQIFSLSYFSLLLVYGLISYRVFTAVPSRVPPVILKFMGNFGNVPTSFNLLGPSQNSIQFQTQNSSALISDLPEVLH